MSKMQTSRVVKKLFFREYLPPNNHTLKGGYANKVRLLLSCGCEQELAAAYANREELIHRCGAKDD